MLAQLPAHQNGLFFYLLELVLEDQPVVIRVLINGKPLALTICVFLLKGYFLW